MRAPAGSSTFRRAPVPRKAELRALARVTEELAVAWPFAGSSLRQKTSYAESAVLRPHAPTVPTTGAGAA
jgi:hypothetical protein